MDREDICEWPDGTTCSGEDLECMLMSKSDDYVVHPWDSIAAFRATGELDHAHELAIELMATDLNNAEAQKEFHAWSQACDDEELADQERWDAQADAMDNGIPF